VAKKIRHRVFLCAKGKKRCIHVDIEADIGAQKGGAQKGVRNRLLTMERILGNLTLWEDRNDQPQGQKKVSGTVY
jgi:hypothetical protein